MDSYTVYNISAWVTSSASILLNLLLIVLIIKNTSKEMKSYRHVLLQTCMVDLIFAFISGFTVPQIETTDTRVFFRTSAPWYPQYGLWPCFAMWMYMFSLLAILWSMIIQALFRFYIIVKRVTPNGARTWIFQGAIFLIGMAISMPYLCMPCHSINLSDNDELKYMELWKDYPALIQSFRSLPLLDFWFIFYVVQMFGLTFTANAAFFVSNWKVAKTLNSSKIHFSPQTMRIHKQFGRRVVLQSIMPCFSLIVLVIIFLLIFAVPSDFAQTQGGYMLVALMPLQYIVVFNPLITLLSIKSYRRALICQSKNATTNVSHLKSTVKVSSTVLVRLT